MSVRSYQRKESAKSNAQTPFTVVFTFYTIPQDVATKTCILALTNLVLMSLNIMNFNIVPGSDF